MVESSSEPPCIICGTTEELPSGDCKHCAQEDGRCTSVFERKRCGRDIGHQEQHTYFLYTAGEISWPVEQPRESDDGDGFFQPPLARVERPIEGEARDSLYDFREESLVALKELIEPLEDLPQSDRLLRMVEDSLEVKRLGGVAGPASAGKPTGDSGADSSQGLPDSASAWESGALGATGTTSDVARCLGCGMPVTRSHREDCPYARSLVVNSMQTRIKPVLAVPVEREHEVTPGPDLSYQDAEYAAWTTWRPESPPDKRDAHGHGFDAGYAFARGEHEVSITEFERIAAGLIEATDLLRETINGYKIDEAAQWLLARGFLADDEPDVDTLAGLLEAIQNDALREHEVTPEAPDLEGRGGREVGRLLMRAEKAEREVKALREHKVTDAEVERGGSWNDASLQRKRVSDALKGFGSESDDPTGRLALADKALAAARDTSEGPS
jgi:hypothetical protein